MITKYGYYTVGIIVIIIFMILAISVYTQNVYIKYFLVLLGITVLIFTLNFFRDPERNIPQDENVIVSPADGRVVIVKDISFSKYIEGDCKQVSIFMSPINVHVNRIPISGTVEYLDYITGEYLVAFHDKADERNEHTEIGLKSKFGKVFFTQVAGFVARRIVYEIKEGDHVKIGDRFGMIKFGSRADVIVSKEWSVKVKIGDAVTAGETILFEYNQ